MKNKSIKLKIACAYTRDVGRQVARIDYDIMNTLNVSTGDVIEIKGKRRTVAKCLPSYPSDEEKEIIRIDGLQRSNCGVAIEDIVLVQKIKVVVAKKVLAEILDLPTDLQELAEGDGFVEYVSDCLESMCFIKGDFIMVPYFGGRLTFQIKEITPNVDAVMLTRKTIFQIKKKEKKE